MPRLLFEKKGNAVWISHLDLMRVFQRAFKRADLPLTHTQGFNPRPSVSIALPLSVGVSSGCELLDFDLDGITVTCDEIRSRLNEKLIRGVQVLDVYEDGQKLKYLAYLNCTVQLTYDGGIPEGAEGRIAELFRSETLLVEKKGKNGIQQQNIIPMIRRIAVSQQASKTLSLEAVICCQNPTLNPMQMVLAIEKYLPDLRPDFSWCHRIELYDTNMDVFR